jgi:glutathione S-transferase
MITLYGGGANFGLPETSPYVTKTEVQLQMAGLPYRKQKALPTDSPKGQLPFIDDDGELVADSAFIRRHIERKYQIDLDAGLDPRQRAEAWAVERMIENHFGWTAGYARFFIPENFEKGPAHFFDTAPEAMRAQLRDDFLGRVRNRFFEIGMTRHSAEEIEGLGVQSLEALSALLGDMPFLFGDRPHGTDAVTFAMLASVLTRFFDSPLRRHAEGFANLAAYTDRMMARFYPAFAWNRVPEFA